MNSKFLKQLSKFGLGLVALVLAAYAIAPDLLSSVLELVGVAGVSGGSGTVMAMSIVAGTGGAGADTRESAKTLKPDSATKPGHLANDVSKLVTMIAPDESPIDTLLRQVESEEMAEDIQVNFEEIEIRGRQLTIDGAFTASGGSASSDKYVTLTFDSTANIVAGETLMCRTVTVSSKPLFIRVESVTDGTDLVAYPLNTTNNVMPTIADNSVFYRMAPTATELQAQAPSVIQYPDMRFNYCQRFTAQVEESFIRKQVKANSSWNFNDQNYMRMYDMKNSLESAHLFGQLSKTTSLADGGTVYTAEGIYYQLDQELSYTSSGIDNSKWVDWTSALFSDNAGSSDRFLFGGKNLIATILKIDSIQKNQDPNSVEIVAGIVLQKVVTLFGTIYIKHHKMFDQMGHPDEGIVVDLNNIKRRTFQPLKSEKLDLKKSGQRYVDARFISEMSCLETRYLDTHRRIVKS